MGLDKDYSTLHVRAWTNQYRMTNKLHNFGTIFNSRDYYNINMAIHMEEATDKRRTWRPRKFTSVEEMSDPFPTQATDVSRQDVRRTWEVL